MIALGLLVQYVSGKIGEELFAGIWIGVASAAKFGVLLCDDSGRTCLCWGAGAGSISGDDGELSIFGEANCLRDPSSKMITGVGGDTTVVSAVQYLENTSGLACHWRKERAEMSVFRSN